MADRAIASIETGNGTGRLSASSAVHSLIDWMIDNLDSIGYGEVGLTFTVHEGKIVDSVQVLKVARRA